MTMSLASSRITLSLPNCTNYTHLSNRLKLAPGSIINSFNLFTFVCFRSERIRAKILRVLAQGTASQTCQHNEGNRSSARESVEDAVGRGRKRLVHEKFPGDHRVREARSQSANDGAFL